MINRNFVSNKIFRSFEESFPLSTVDLLLIREEKILLTKRTIEPFKGMWHFPGGMIRHGESRTDAVKRIAKGELGIEVQVEKAFGTYEDFSTKRHFITTLYKITNNGKKIKIDKQASDYNFFEFIPPNIIPIHKKMLIDLGYS